MELTKEQANLCKEFLAKLLFHSSPYDYGYKSNKNLVFAFDEYERREMEKIIRSEDHAGKD